MKTWEMIKSATEAQKVNAHSKIFCKDCKNNNKPQKCYDCESGSEWEKKGMNLIG